MEEWEKEYKEYEKCVKERWKDYYVRMSIGSKIYATFWRSDGVHCRVVGIVKRINSKSISIDVKFLGHRAGRGKRIKDRWLLRIPMPWSSEWNTLDTMNRQFRLLTDDEYKYEINRT